MIKKKMYHIVQKLGGLNHLSPYELDALENVIKQGYYNYDISKLNKDRNNKTIFNNLIILSNLTLKYTQFPEIEYLSLKYLLKYKKPKFLLDFLESVKDEIKIINNCNIIIKNLHIICKIDSINFTPNHINSSNNVTENTNYILDIEILDNDNNEIKEVEEIMKIISLRQFNKFIFFKERLEQSSSNYFYSEKVVFSDPEQPDWRPNETVPEDYYAL